MTDFNKCEVRLNASHFQTRGFTSCLDFPAGFFFRDLLEAFPDAKFVLTTAKDVSAWSSAVQQSLVKPYEALQAFPASVAVAAMPKRAMRLEVRGQERLDSEASNSPPLTNAPFSSRCRTRFTT